MKIEALIELAESTLPLNKKTEKVNANKLDLAILFLLMGDKEIFKEIFPVREVVENLEVLKPYFHEKINDVLFSSLSGIDDFAIKCLEDDTLFETFNEISKGEMIKSLSQSLERGYLLNKVLEKGLLESYFKKSIFDNGFININHLDKDYIPEIEAFVNKHSDYFTPEYFASIEEVHENFFEFVLPKLLKFYANDFNEFYNQFKKQFDLDDPNHVSLLSNVQVKQLINNPNIASTLFTGSNSNGCDLLGEALAKLPASDLPDDTSKAVIQKICYSFADGEGMDYARALVKRFGMEHLIKLFEDSYSTPDKILFVFDEIRIQSGDYSHIKSIKNLNNFALSDSQVIAIVLEKIKNSDYFYMPDVTDLKQFDTIKEQLGEAFLKIPKLVEEDELFSLGLGDSWYIKNLGLNKFLTHKYDDADKKAEFINTYKDLYPKEVSKIFLKKLNSEDYYHSAEEDFISLLKAGLISSKEIFKLIKKEKLSVKVQFLDCLSLEEFLELKKERKSDSTFIHSIHSSDKERWSFINKMKPYELAQSRNLEDWINFPMTPKQVQSIWDKIQEKKNLEIKDVMFALLDNKKSEMSEELYNEIYARAKKLKGFEDAVSVAEGEEEESLEKKFTKAITNAANALKALNDDEFDSILTQKIFFE